MIVVAIDGPSGAGKSSTAKAVAQRAGWNYLDTGALYRALTWLALRENVDSAPEILAALKRFPLRFIANPASPKYSSEMFALILRFAPMKLLMRLANLAPFQNCVPNCL